MDLMDQQFGPFDHIVVGLLTGSAGEAIVFYSGIGITRFAKNFDGYEGNIELNGQILFLCRGNGLESILEEQGFDIGKQSYFEVYGLESLQIFHGKLCFQGMENISDKRNFVHSLRVLLVHGLFEGLEQFEVFAGLFEHTRILHQ